VVSRVESDAFFGTVLRLAYAESEVGLRLMDGRSERIRLGAARPTEFIVKTPVQEKNGAIRLDLEILSFDLVGHSKTLWPGAQIRATAGAAAGPDAQPVYGTVRFAAGRTIEQGATTEVHLWLQLKIPLGLVRNGRAIRMKGVVHGIPPEGVRFESQNDAPLLDRNGRVVGTLSACLNEL